MVTPEAGQGGRLTKSRRCPRSSVSGTAARQKTCRRVSRAGAGCGICRSSLPRVSHPLLWPAAAWAAGSAAVFAFVSASHMETGLQRPRLHPRPPALPGCLGRWVGSGQPSRALGPQPVPSRQAGCPGSRLLGGRTWAVSARGVALAGKRGRRLLPQWGIPVRSLRPGWGAEGGGGDVPGGAARRWGGVRGQAGKVGVRAGARLAFTPFCSSLPLDPRRRPLWLPRRGTVSGPARP